MKEVTGALWRLDCTLHTSVLFGFLCAIQEVRNFTQLHAPCHDVSPLYNPQ